MVIYAEKSPPSQNKETKESIVLNFFYDFIYLFDRERMDGEVGRAEGEREADSPLSKEPNAARFQNPEIIT